MTDLLLYTLVVPQDSLSGLQAQLQQQLATEGVLNSDNSIVEQLSSDPGDQTVSGLYKARYADKMAAELEELAQASGFSELPLTGLEESTQKDGYYALENADVDQVQPRTPLVQSYTLELTKEGTRNSHWRAHESNRRQTDHEFGNETSPARVGAPAAASKVQWIHPETYDRAPASPIETRSAELGDVKIYNLEDGEAAIGATNPTLIYSISYAAEESVDCRIYDTRGHSSKHDSDGHLQWQKLFLTQHDFDDEIVFDNGLVRLRLDEAAGTIAAEEWDASSDAWTSVGLSKPSTVELFDVDLQEVAMIRNKAQLTFDVDGSLFALDAIVHAGWDAVQFDIPAGEEGPIPQALEDWIRPVASESVVDPNASKTLISRNSVSR